MARLKILGNASDLLEQCWLISGQEHLGLACLCDEDIQKQCMNIVRLDKNCTQICAEENHMLTFSVF